MELVFQVIHLCYPLDARTHSIASTTDAQERRSFTSPWILDYAQAQWINLEHPFREERIGRSLLGQRAQFLFVEKKMSQFLGKEFP